MVSELTITAIALVGASVTLAILVWLAAIFDLIAGPNPFSSLENDKGNQVIPGQAFSAPTARSQATCSECGARLDAESYMYCLSCLKQDPAES